MRFRLTIAAKIGLGFGLLLLAFLINVVLTVRTLNKSTELNEEIATIYNPSSNFLSSLYDMVHTSEMLIKSWVFIDRKADTPDKQQLKRLHQERFPEVTDTLIVISEEWTPEHQETLKNIVLAINDTLLPKHQFIMERLSTFESYDDPMTVFEIIPMVEEGGEIIYLTKSILERLDILMKSQNKIVSSARDEMEESFTQFRRSVILMALAIILATIVIAVITIRSLVVPINFIKNILLKMSKGILPEKKAKEGKDEIGQMSMALNAVVNSLKEISNFAKEIGKGNFDTDFKPLGEQDDLGNSLLTMREELSKAAEEEAKRKTEDQQRNWATQGIAKFSEILRKNNDNLEVLSYDIISNLVKYMDANQGGLFIVNNNDEDNVFIEMTACYAYNRRKFLEKEIQIGEGLVGRCVQEGETIYMTAIPKDYITITSGLGEDTPTSLLIVPLKLNDEIFGVIEIASFHNIEKYQIDFVEKIGESIASTISTVKINVQTAHLLESSRQQAEEMSAQEEEMRQNMEELRATQEQSARREAELTQKVEELKEKLRTANE